MPGYTVWMRLTPEEFEDAVAEAVESIPPEFRQYLDSVNVDVEDAPSREIARKLDVPRDQLLGAYFGTPLTERHVEDPRPVGDRVVIYQSNIERMCRSRPELVRQIAVTVLHEIGHHFGMSEEELEERGFG